MIDSSICHDRIGRVLRLWSLLAAALAIFALAGDAHAATSGPEMSQYRFRQWGIAQDLTGRSNDGKDNPEPGWIGHDGGFTEGGGNDTKPPLITAIGRALRDPGNTVLRAGPNRSCHPKRSYGLIRRRHVLFAMGYDPKGVVSYHRQMRSQLKRFQAIWPVKAEAGELKDASGRLAHWTVDTAGPNWSVSTRYDFMRLDDIVKTNLRMPLTRHVLRALRWWGNDIVTGTTWQLWRASGRFAAHLAYAKGLFLVWLLLAAGAGGRHALDHRSDWRGHCPRRLPADAAGGQPALRPFADQRLAVPARIRARRADGVRSADRSLRGAADRGRQRRGSG